ncbi:MAG: DUF3341 domain-containing protein, partial [Ignavibacteria bacterium]|nr:DUF3341 domain-containing protein [Ignavibacteria bacterium]
LGFITLAFGLTGAASALGLMYFTMAKDYPMIISGKPFFALPAFIPVTFELTVLFATLATVIGMLTFFFKFPDNSHPLHDTDYMKSISLDKYGLCIEAADDIFNEAEVKEFLISLGAYETSTVYQEEKRFIDAFSPKFLGFLTVVFILVSGGTYFTLNKLLFMPPFTWMMRQDRVNAQSASTFYADGYGMRNPVAGTVARGFLPYEYKGQKEQPLNPVTNPLLPTKQVLELGQKKFLTYCSPCHGNYAEGDSRLRGQFPKPPSLHSQKVRDWADGNIYHVIMTGQNVMPSYSSQITNNEAWAIITYVRALQKAKNATLDEIQQVKKEVSVNGTK